MTDLTAACSALARHERDLTHKLARMLSWMWRQRRRREIIRALNKVDDHLLRDAGIDRDGIEQFVDTLIARR
jgi:uncharacterized protein YjiS (DUF1127 family)